MGTDFLDRLASQIKHNKDAACRRAIQRVLAFMKERYESGEFDSHTEAEAEFRRLVDAEESRIIAPSQTPVIDNEDTDLSRPGEPTTKFRFKILTPSK